MRFDEQDLNRFRIKPALTQQERDALRRAVEAEATRSTTGAATRPANAILWFATLAALALAGVLYFNISADKLPDYSPRPTADEEPQGRAENVFNPGLLGGGMARTGVYPGALGKRPAGCEWNELVFLNTRDWDQNETHSCVFALDAQTGNLVWSLPVRDMLMNSSMLPLGGALYYATGNTVHAVDALTGAAVASLALPDTENKRWQYEMITKPLAHCNGLLFAATMCHNEPARLFAIFEDLSAVAWSLEMPDLHKSIHALAAYGDAVYACYDKELLALDVCDGTTRWSFAAGDIIISSPLVASDTVCFGSHDRNVYMLDARTGKQQWKQTLDGRVFAPVSCAGGTLFASTGLTQYSGNETLHALDAATGRILWRQKIGHRSSCPLALDGGVIAFNTYSRDTRCAFDAGSGKLLWRKDRHGKDNERTWSSGEGLALHRGQILTADKDDLLCCDATTGKELWRASLSRHFPDAQAGVIADIAVSAPVIASFLPAADSAPNNHWVADEEEPVACPLQRVDTHPLLKKASAVYSAQIAQDGTLEADNALVTIFRNGDFYSAQALFWQDETLVEIYLEIHKDGRPDNPTLPDWMPNMKERMDYRVIADLQLRLCDHPETYYLPPYIVTQFTPVDNAVDINAVVDACDRDFITRFDRSQQAADQWVAQTLANHPNVREEDRERKLGDASEAGKPGLQLIRYGRNRTELGFSGCQLDWLPDQTFIVYRYDYVYVSYYDIDEQVKPILEQPFLSMAYEFDAKGRLQKVRIMGPQEAVDVVIDTALLRR